MLRIDSSVRTIWCEVGKVPAATIASGDVINVEMTSFTEGFTFENLPGMQMDQAIAPLTAPIIVAGAQPGDTLRIDVLDLRFTREFGCVLLLPGRGAFPNLTSELMARPVAISDHEVRFSEAIRIPTRKMIGKISVAPPGERITSSFPGRHGGNLDNNDIGVGSSVFLPVFVEGAHLGLGDAHAVQADGECGISAVEVEMECIVRVTVLQGPDVQVPIVRSGGTIATMGVGETLDDAAAEALGEMHRLMRNHLHLDAKETAMLMSLVCDVHVSQLVNRLVSVKAKVPDRFLQLA
jgi:amidase